MLIAKSPLFQLRCRRQQKKGRTKQNFKLGHRGKLFNLCQFFIPVLKVFHTDIPCKVLLVILGCEIFSHLKSSGEVVFARTSSVDLVSSQFCKKFPPWRLYFAKLEQYVKNWQFLKLGLTNIPVPSIKVEILKLIGLKAGAR